jgi:hypothetical protein
MFFWPYRRALILLYREGAITREEFIDFWKVVYGKDR